MWCGVAPRFGGWRDQECSFWRGNMWFDAGIWELPLALYIYVYNEDGNGNINIHIEVQEQSSSEAHRLIHSSRYVPAPPNPNLYPFPFPSTYSLSIGDQHEKQFHPQQGEHSTCTTCKYFHSFLGLCEMSPPIGFEILGHHHSWLNNSCLLGEISSGKGLNTISIHDSYIWIDVQRHQSFHQFSCPRACQSTLGFWNCHHLSWFLERREASWGLFFCWNSSLEVVW